MARATSKKLRQVVLDGTRTLVDPTTGEEFNVNQVCVTEADANFSKIWLANILTAVKDFSSASMEVLFWLVKETEQTKGTNTIHMTIREIADKTERSTYSVNKVLKVLESHDIIRRKIGVIFVNPDVVYKGNHGGRMNVLTVYKSMESAPAEDGNVRKRIERRSLALKRLSAQYEYIRNQLDEDLTLLTQQSLDEKEDLPDSDVSETSAAE